MAARRDTRTAALEAAIGYKFKDKSLARRAVTHASYKSVGPQNNNERLEFLGDRVLGLVMAEFVWSDDPLAREGDLAKRFNTLVRREACASVARRLNLGAYLTLSDSEASSGGRDKDTILADAIEAILGAIFLDAGFDRARDTVLRLWSDHMDGGVETVSDPKSVLQEWAQGRGLPLPRYRELSRSGPDHAPVFVAEVAIDGVEAAVGEGTSKRQAEQAAARAILDREAITSKATLYDHRPS
ncbi:MAG: ribonuclease III [Pseudomonadota bacterium]